MAAAMAPGGRLKLDRSLGSPMFGSWRLDPDADVQHSTHGLQGRVQLPMAGGNGFLQAKTVYQHDHMHQLPSGIYLFLQVRLGAPSLAPCMYVRML